MPWPTGTLRYSQGESREKLEAARLRQRSAIDELRRERKLAAVKMFEIFAAENLVGERIAWEPFLRDWLEYCDPENKARGIGRNWVAARLERFGYELTQRAVLGNPVMREISTPSGRKLVPVRDPETGRPVRERRQRYIIRLK